MFIGRWIALIRFATAWLAGINGMPLPTFFAWNAMGGITWAITYGVAGYYGGEAVAHVMERVGIVAAVVLVVAVIVGVVYRRSCGRAPSLTTPSRTIDRSACR